MTNPINVTYIKLEPYLQDYLREIMHIPKGVPLVLPKRQQLELEANLVHNPDVVRKGIRADGQGGRNKRGFYKDSTSYSQWAVEFARGNNLVEGSSRMKIPSESECAKLAPFALPKKIDKSPSDKFYEVKPEAVTAIRSYLRSAFYDDLHSYVRGRINYCRANGIKYSKKELIEKWMKACHISGNLSSVRAKSYIAQPTFDDFDPATIVRSYDHGMAHKVLAIDINARFFKCKY